MREGLNREHFFKKKKLHSIKFYDALIPITAFVKNDGPVDPHKCVLSHYEGKFLAVFLDWLKKICF